MSKLLRAGFVLVGLLVVGLVFETGSVLAQKMGKPQPPQPEKEKDPEREDEFAHNLSLSSNTRAKLQVEAARDYIKDKDWENAVYVFRLLLETDQDCWVRIPDETGRKVWTSAWTEANRLIGGMPIEGLKVYENECGGPARGKLKDALKEHDLKKLASISHKQLHTEAGYEAACILGTHYLDRGEFVYAAMCFEKILSHRQAEKASPATLLKACLAYRRVGDKTKEDGMWARLSKENPGGIEFGRKRVSMEDVERDLERFAEVGAYASTELRLFRGNTARNGSCLAEIPFLEDPVWQTDLYDDRNAAKTWIEKVCPTAGTPPNMPVPVLPGFHPIAAEDMVVFRAFDGIHAVNVKKGGKLQWSTRPWGQAGAPLSLQQLLTDPKTSNIVSPWLQNYERGNSLGCIIENSNIGALSTDNRFVFAVDDLGAPPFMNVHMGWQPNPRSQFQHLESSVQANKLQAYGLTSGKLVWEVGGWSNEKEKDRYQGFFEDTFFLGAPLPLGGKLYSLCEKDSKLLLVCLEPSNGDLVWKQELAMPTNRLPQDVKRRMSACPLAYADGILVCPTNCGAILGVDLLTHSLVWAYPYAEAEPEQAVNPPGRFRGMPQQVNFRLDWKYSAPIIADGKVVFTAPDGSAVYCVNLRDGKEVWKPVKRAGDLYVAGVYNGKALIAGRTAFRAVDLKTGKDDWRVDTSSPTGLGVLSQGSYYMPAREVAGARESEICIIDLDRGTLKARTKSRRVKDDRGREIEFGNLLFYEGTVVSQTVHNLTAFPLLALKLEKINDRLAKNPKDPEALLDRGIVLLDKGEFDPAISDLRVALASKQLGAQEDKARKKLFDAMTDLLKKDFTVGEKHLDEYRQLCDVGDAGEKKRRFADLYSLIAQGREKQGRLVDAFKAYMDFSTQNSSGELMQAYDDAGLKTRPDVWAQGRIAAMVNKATPEQLKPLEQLIQDRWGKVKDSKDTDELRGFINVFGSMFSFGREARLVLAERLIDKNAYVDAELQLLQVRGNTPLSPKATDDQVTARAVEGLAKLMVRREMMRDAAYWYRVLGRDFGKVDVRDGKTGADLLNDLATDKRFLPFLDDLAPQWGKKKFQGKEEADNRRPPNMQASVCFEPVGEDTPFIRNIRVTFNYQSDQQMHFFDRSENKEFWTLKRPDGMNTNHTNYFSQPYIFPPRFQHQGALAFFQLGPVIRCCDLVEKKVLWEENLFGGKKVNAGMKQQLWISVQNGRLFVQDNMGMAEQLGMLGPVGPGYACILDKEGLRVVEPTTGELLWKSQDVPLESTLFGDDQHIYVVGNGSTNVLRARDGATVRVRDFSKEHKNSKNRFGRMLLVSEKNGATVRMYDILAEKDLWSQEFSEGARLLNSEDRNFVAVVEPNKQGALTVVDLNTFKTAMTAKVEIADIKDGTLLVDGESFYIAFRDQVANQWRLQPNVAGVPMVVADGKLYSFDKGNGKLRWKFDATSQMIVLEQFRDLPLVIMTCRVQDPQTGQMKINTQVIEKRTGKLAYRHNDDLARGGRNWNVPTYSSLIASPRDGKIELVGPTAKLILTQVDDKDKG